MSICVLPAIVKILAKIILKRIKEHLERSIYRERTILCSRHPVLTTLTLFVSLWRSVRSLDHRSTYSH